MRILGLVSLIASTLIFVSCTAPQLTVNPVGPAPAAWSPLAPAGAKGQLQVYTQTDEFEIDHDVPYFPHTDYRVLTPAGKSVRRVWNSQSHEDEMPTVVSLPAGNYMVQAQAEFYGVINVPVVVKPGALTRVFLQPGWVPGATVASSDLVQLPHGYYIGWRGN
jgi:hypothetical protein